MTKAGRRHARAAALLLASALTACTSVSWDDSSGVRHHLGLVAIETVVEDGARVVRRYAVGSDLDVARGGAWTLGASRTESIRLAEIPFTDPRDLTAQFVEAARTEPDMPEAPGTWRFLYVTEDDSPRAALVDRGLVGVAVASGPALRGLYAGYAHGQAIDAELFGPDAALYIARRDGYAPRCRLWRWTPATPSAEGLER